MPSPQNTETPGRAVDLITVILRCDISRAVWCNGFTTIHVSVGLHFLEQKWASGKEAHVDAASRDPLVGRGTSSWMFFQWSSDII